METFTNWLETELNKRDWRIADLARKAGVDKGSLSRIFSGTRKPGPDICLAIAKALNLSDVMVFRQAGLLSSKSEMGPEAEELLHLFRQLGEHDKKRILQTARTWVEKGGS